jgi:hypothetical protein
MIFSNRTFKKYYTVSRNSICDSISLIDHYGTVLLLWSVMEGDLINGGLPLSRGYRSKRN